MHSLLVLFLFLCIQSIAILILLTKNRRLNQELRRQEKQTYDLGIAQQEALAAKQVIKDGHMKKLADSAERQNRQKELNMMAKKWREEQFQEWTAIGKQLIYNHRQNLANVKDRWTNIDPYGNPVRSGWHDVDRPYFIEAVLLPSFMRWVKEKHKVEITSDIDAFPGCKSISIIAGIPDLIAPWGEEQIEQTINGMSLE